MHASVDIGGGVSEDQKVTVGVDTHKDVHVAAVLDEAGRVLGTRGFPATVRGYAQFATWAESFGTVAKVGMEGTGSYGAGLLRFLTEYGLTVVEVDRPDRSTRRRIGKTDTIDAESAARAVLSGRASGTPKTRDAQVEMVRALRVARRGAMKARIQAGGQIEALIVSAPESVRQLVRGLAGKRRVRVCAALRPGLVTDPATATKAALRSLARRWLALQAEIDDLDTHLTTLVTAVAPDLVALPGVGVDTAGQLLVTAGDNPTGCAPKPPSPDSAASPLSRPVPDGPTAIACTAVVTATPTAPSGASPWSGCAVTSPPRTMSPAGSARARPRPRSCAA
jgi:transposase